MTRRANLDTNAPHHFGGQMARTGANGLGGADQAFVTMNTDETLGVAKALSKSHLEIDESLIPKLVAEAMSGIQVGEVDRLARGVGETNSLAGRLLTDRANTIAGFLTTPTNNNIPTGTLSNPARIDLGKSTIPGTGVGGPSRTYGTPGGLLGPPLRPADSDGPDDIGSIDLGEAIRQFSEANQPVLGPLSQRDIAIDRMDQAAVLLGDANRIDDAAAAIPEYWAYARSGMDERAAGVRDEAAELIRAAGFNPDAIAPVLETGEVSGRELMKHIDLSRAQALFDSADSISSSAFAHEAESIRLEAEAILDDVFLSADSRAVVDRFVGSMTTFEIAAMSDFEQAAGDAIAASVFDSADPLRAAGLMMNQGFTVDGAVSHVATRSGTGPDAMTIAELQAQVAYMEANNVTHQDDYDAVVTELNDRSRAVGGQSFSEVDAEAMTLAERSGMSYADALSMTLGAQYAAIGGSPDDRQRQADAMLGDLALLAQARAFAQDKARTDQIGLTPGDSQAVMRDIIADQVARDPHASASQMLSLLGAGASLPEAAWFSEALGPDVSAYDAAMVLNDARHFDSDVERVDFSDAAFIAVNAHLAGVDVADIADVANDEADMEVIGALQLVIEANRRDMTVNEYTAYDGLYDEDVFAALDNITGGDADNKVSVFDMAYAVAHGEEMGLDPDIIAAAQAFLDEPDLMARLDTARDFSDNVMEGDGFGRDRMDDGLFSLDDQQNFELKQNVNFILGDLSETIDTAALGGKADNHLSRQDVQATLARKDEFDLTDAEVQALEIVLEGKMYDQGWLEKNRDSIAIAAAVVAGTAIFIGTGGMGAGLSVGLVGSVVASTAVAGATAGVVTQGINEQTGVDPMDGVKANMFQGAVVGGLAAPGLALGGGTLTAAGSSGGARALAGLGLAGESAGLLGAGAFDFAIDPVYDGDNIDMDRIHGNADQASLLLAGGSIAASGSSLVGRKLTGDAVDAAADAVPTNFANLGGEGANTPLAATVIDNALDNADELARLADDAARQADDLAGVADEVVDFGDDVLDDAIASIDIAIADADGLLDDAIELADAGGPELADELLDEAIAKVDDVVGSSDEIVGEAADYVDEAVDNSIDAAEAAQAAAEAADDAARAAEAAREQADLAGTLDAERAAVAAGEARDAAQRAADELAEAVANGEQVIPNSAAEIFGKDVEDYVVETVADIGQSQQGAIVDLVEDPGGLPSGTSTPSGAQ